MSEKVDLGQNIRAILDILGWSQEYLGERLDIHQSTVSKWLEDVNDEKLSKISAALEVSKLFIQKFRPIKDKHQENHFTAREHAKNVGIVEVYNDNNINEILIMQKEQQILLLKGQIGRLRNHKLLLKLCQATENEFSIVDAEIEEINRDIIKLEADIKTYRNK